MLRLGQEQLDTLKRDLSTAPKAGGADAFCDAQALSTCHVVAEWMDRIRTHALPAVTALYRFISLDGAMLSDSCLQLL